MRQLADKPYRIRQQKIPVISGADSAHRRIQRGEQHILFQNLFLRVAHPDVQHFVHQRRLTRVCIAYQSHRRQFAFFPALALCLPVLFHDL